MNCEQEWDEQENEGDKVDEEEIGLMASNGSGR